MSAKRPQDLFNFFSWNSVNIGYYTQTLLWQAARRALWLQRRSTDQKAHFPYPLKLSSRVSQVDNIVCQDW